MKIRWQYALPIILLLLPFFYAMGFAFPTGDDFARSNVARCWFDIGKAFEEMGRCWWTWSGRYTHHFLVVFLGKGAESRFGYALVCWLVSMLYWVSLWGIFAELLGKEKRGEAFFFSTVCMLGLYASYVPLPIAFYEITDVLGLTIGNGLVLTFIWALCVVWHRDVLSLRLRIFLFASGILAIGCYEHAAIATVLAAGTACMMALYVRHKHARLYVVTLCVVTFFFLFSFLARGNFRRQTKRHVSFDQIVDQLFGSFTVWRQEVLNVFTSPFSVLAVWLGLFVRPEQEKLASMRQKQIPTWVCFVAGSVLLCSVSAGIVFVHAMSEVSIEPASKLAMSMTLLEAFCFAAMLLIGLEPVRKLLWFKRATRFVWLPATIVLVYVLVTRPNYQEMLYSQFSGESAAYAASMEKRNAYLHWQGYQNPSAKAEVAQIRLRPFPNRVGSSIPADPLVWPANHAAEMFGVHRVFSSPLDAAMAYGNAKNISGPDGVTFPVSETGEAVVRFVPNVPGGPNDTFRYHWVSIAIPASAVYPKQIYSKVLLHRQDWRPLLLAFQKKYEKQVLPHRSVSFDRMCKYAGIGAIWKSEKWMVQDRTTEKVSTVMLPVAAPEWGRVKGLFVSIDGNTYYQVPVDTKK